VWHWVVVLVVLSQPWSALPFLEAPSVSSVTIRVLSDAQLVKASRIGR